MAILEIRNYGDPVLREKAQPINNIDEDLKQMAADMIETMYSAQGIGLAANQVGSLNRIFVVDAGSKKNRESKNPRVFLNPEILESSVEDDTYSEGCLSIPDLEGDVYRPIIIKARWMDLDGKMQEEQLEDLEARVYQHELDHLDGIMFIDHMPDGERKKLVGKLNRLKQDTLEKLGLKN